MIRYRIIYSGRRSIAISIGSESGVTVRAPYRTSLKTIEDLVQLKSSWIKKHLENHNDQIRINSSTEYTDGEYHFFVGRKYPLRIVRSEKEYVNLDDDAIEIGLRQKSKGDNARILLAKWYKKRAEELFMKKLSEIQSKYSHYNFSPKVLTVRSMKGRWGSCSSKGRITLSTDLIKIDEKYTEYVIFHELCHLKHHNHSSAYYNLLSTVYPEWKNVRHELRKYVK
jgi:predicted metal-dependent hydrolase